MKHFVCIFLFLSLSIANSDYCLLSETPNNNSAINSREFYNIGDIISEEDQAYEFSVCHSDGNYNSGSIFKLSDYSGDIILISMNATW